MNIDSIKNIVVIDDNDTDLLIARIVIEKSGFKGNIVVKSSGKAGIDFLASIVESPNLWPEIVYLDINMPVISGFGFIEEYEKLAPKFKSKIKIAVLSSSDSKSDQDRFSQSTHIIDFLPKPLSIEGFKQSINKL